MYNRVRPVTFAYPGQQAGALREKPLDIRGLFRFLLANGLLITIFAGIFAAIALLYIIVTPPTFLTSAQLMLTFHKVASTDDQPTIAEEALIESQMEIMKSNDVLQAVVEELNLPSNSEFASGGLAILSDLRSLFSRLLHARDDANDEASPDVRKENYIISTLRHRLWVRRVEQSAVMEISAASSNPQMAAAIANAVAEQYIARNIAMKSQSAQQSSDWLAQRVDQLRQDVLAADRAVAEFRVSGDAGDQFKLSELKSVADTNRRLYENYLLSWSEAKQRISYPVSDAVFVSRAVAPASKSQPKSVLLIAFALVLGASCGIVAAIVRHFADRLVTSADRINAEAEVPCIGKVSLTEPVRPGDKLKGPLSEMPRVNGMNRLSNGRELSFNRDLRDLKATVAGLRRSRKANLIGIVGVEKKAGATTVAYNLALLASTSGSKTLLIDASAVNPTLSRAFAGDRTMGLMELLDASGAYADFIQQIDKRLTVLPIGSFCDVTPGERIGSERIAFSFADLKERFDLIVVDLPSIPESADAKAVAPHLDGSIIVARYGKTSFDALNNVVSDLNDVGAEVFGVVLNAIPQQKQQGERS